MWLTGCAVVLIVGIRPNKPIQWKKVLFLLPVTPFIDLSRCISESTDFSVGKSERCTEHGKIAYAHSHPTTNATFLFSLLIVMSKSTTTILYFVHMRWAIHVKKQLILSLFLRVFFPPFSTVVYFLLDIAQKGASENRMFLMLHK